MHVSRIAFLRRFAQRLQPTPTVLKPAVKSIVLVDDERSYAELMQQLLADHFDCPVYSFSRPLEALQALAELDPGVVVTDYFMPQVNGIELICRASPIVPQAAFIMISGNNVSEFAHELTRLPLLKAFIAKPVGYRRLAEEITRVWPTETPAPAHRADATSL